MKNYKKIPFNRIKDIGAYVEKKLREEHVIIRILVNEDEKEIAELVSYANDNDCKSYYRNIADSDEQLKTCVITESLNPYYAFKDSSRSDDCYADIDIETDCQNIIDFQSVKEDFQVEKRNFITALVFNMMVK